MKENKEENKIKELITKCGGSTKFARRINAPLTTVAQWFYGSHACKSWLFDMIAFCMERDYYSPVYKGEKKKPKMLYEVNDGENIFYYGSRLTDAKEIINDCIKEMPDEKIFLIRNGKEVWSNINNSIEELKSLQR